MQWKYARRGLRRCPPQAAPPAPLTGPRQRQARVRPTALIVLLVSVALASGVFLSVACSQKRQPTGNTRPPPAALRVGWPNGVEPALLDNFARTWAAQQRVGLDVVGYDLDDGPAAPPDVDVCVMPPAWLPRWAAAGALQLVPARYEKESTFAYASLLPIYQQLLTWDRTRYGVPLTGEAFLCFHREDLFQSHAAAFHKQTGRPLKAPETWDEFEAIARFFHEHREGGAGPSLPPLPAGDLDLEREFYAVAASIARLGVRDDRKRELTPQDLAFHFDPETGAPRLDTPGFVHALRLMQRLQKYRSSLAEAEPPTWFRDGKAVLCLAPPTPWVRRFQAADAAARGRFGFGRVPGSRTVFDFHGDAPMSRPDVNQVPYLGAAGWLGVVPKSSGQAETAFALLAWLSDPKVSRDVVTQPLHGGGPFRPQHTNIAEVSWDALGLGPRTAELVTCLRLAVHNPYVTNPVLRLRIPDERRYRAALAVELRAALLEKKDAAQALADAAEAWRRLSQERGVEKHRAEYRLSVGLPP